MRFYKNYAVRGSVRFVNLTSAVRFDSVLEKVGGSRIGSVRGSADSGSARFHFFLA